jgi:hypothetical protein
MTGLLGAGGTNLVVTFWVAENQGPAICLVNSSIFSQFCPNLKYCSTNRTESGEYLIIYY